MKSQPRACGLLLVAMALLWGSQALAGDANIPEGARWTVYCATVSGPAHVEQSKAWRDALARETKMPDWYVVHSSDHSTLYYGHYRAIDDRQDAKEAARATADRKVIGAMVDSRTGQRMFRNAIMMALEEADPTAPAAWDLRNAKGYWSLQIAAFRDDPQRKEKAVAVVRDLRAQGKEAYYFHGPSISSVCIGAFPESAARMDDGPPNLNPNAAVLVAPSGVPVNQNMQTEDGKPILVKQPKLVIQDPVLFKLKQEYATNATNGVVGRRVTLKDGRQEDVFDPSFLVVIPHDAGGTAVAEQRAAIPSALTNQAGAVGPNDPRADAARPAVAPNPPPIAPAPRRPRGGHLRGLDDY